MTDRCIDCDAPVRRPRRREGDTMTDIYDIARNGEATLDPTNACLVGSNGQELTQVFAPPMNREQAMVHAAWVVTLAESLPGDASFADALASVHAT